MSMTVLVYDPSGAPLRDNRIEFEQQDETGEVLGFAVNANIELAANTQTFGVRFSDLNPARSVVVVWVDDTMNNYAAVSLPSMNPAIAATVPVTLYRLPSPKGDNEATVAVGDSPGGGADRQDSGTLAAHNLNLNESIIGERVRTEAWSEEQGQAVRILIVTVTRAYLVVNPSPSFQQRRQRWATLLRLLGITLPAPAPGEASAKEAESDVAAENELTRAEMASQRVDNRLAALESSEMDVAAENELTLLEAKLGIGTSPVQPTTTQTTTDSDIAWLLAKLAELEAPVGGSGGGGTTGGS